VERSSELEYFFPSTRLVDIPSIPKYNSFQLSWRVKASKLKFGQNYRENYKVMTSNKYYYDNIINEESNDT
jgi:hypothetical protein